jgi:uncharacterized protein YbaA (DUF1428 family)
MKNGNYVDGFVFVVQNKNYNDYKKMAQDGARMWLKCGALDYKECILDDAKPPMAGFTFPALTKVKKTEDVWLAYIVYKNKKHRDQVNKKVMVGMDKNYEKYKDLPMPFDPKRMAVGGFKVIVNG